MNDATIEKILLDYRKNFKQIPYGRVLHSYRKIGNRFKQIFYAGSGRPMFSHIKKTRNKISKSLKYCHGKYLGEMAERSNAAVLKTVRLARAS